jgi:fucose permease
MMTGVAADRQERARVGYRRDGFTWAAFAALTAFGVLNAVLGPALPYLRATEHISYLVGSLHQVAFAVGGGLAGLAASRGRGGPGRAVLIRVGLLGAGVAGLGIGYGGTAVITIVAAFLVSLLGTSALVRLWAALADAHGARRTVAMTEGEVSVSLGGIIAPLLVGGLAITALSWRFAFVIGAVLVIATVAASGAVHIPPSAQPVPRTVSHPRSRIAAVRRSWLAPTLVLAFAVVALEWSLSFWLASYLHDSVGVARGPAATMVALLYAANLLGRLITSRLARRTTTARLLAGAIATGLVGIPVLLAATDLAVAGVGIAVVGAGVGATFPLASSLHVGAASRAADGAVGQVIAVAAGAQVLGPVAVAAIAQAFGLRIGLLTLPAFALLAAAALTLHQCTGPHQR